MFTFSFSRVTFVWGLVLQVFRPRTRGEWSCQRSYQRSCRPSSVSAQQNKYHHVDARLSRNPLQCGSGTECCRCCCCCSCSWCCYHFNSSPSSSSPWPQKKAPTTLEWKNTLGKNKTKNHAHNWSSSNSSVLSMPSPSPAAPSSYVRPTLPSCTHRTHHWQTIHVHFIIYIFQGIYYIYIYIPDLYDL